MNMQSNQQRAALARQHAKDIAADLAAIDARPWWRDTTANPWRIAGGVVIGVLMFALYAGLERLAP